MSADILDGKILATELKDKLKIEVEGTINLYWNIINRKYHYFIEKDGTITELVNTKSSNKKFQEEYTIMQLKQEEKIEMSMNVWLLRAEGICCLS